jgi:hypothetical protein
MKLNTKKCLQYNRFRAIVGLIKARISRNERRTSRILDNCIEVVERELSLRFHSLALRVDAVIKEFIRKRDYQAVQGFIDDLTSARLKEICSILEDKLTPLLLQDGSKVNLTSPSLSLDDQRIREYCLEAARSLKLVEVVTETNQAAWSMAVGRVMPVVELEFALKQINPGQKLFEMAKVSIGSEQERLLADLKSRIRGIIENTKQRMLQSLIRQVAAVVFAKHDENEKELRQHLSVAVQAKDSVRPIDFCRWAS